MFFDYDSDKPKESSIKLLDSFLAGISEFGDKKITVTGHADSCGTESYNLELSKRRAIAIAQILLANGASKKIIEIYYKGESEPVSKNNAENRRVDITFEEK
jgi:outer membrane protein OmpA-like peptidoglycan-associated protein